MIFLDSSFITAMFNDRDSNHQKAKQLLKAVPEINTEPKAINNIVFNEVLNKLNKPYYHAKREEILNFLYGLDKIYFVKEKHYNEAVNLMKYYKYTVNYSDCLILLSLKKTI
ncbi:type II toxin-antitoxin system VapC family toxin [uncultured Methanobrevibacter sp.]|uniref:type II toxin-antitoxin system VapC family toxin n=1 Tax=uncultured Methanobrevibacter sp. TaxID=253161 RepID=UPI0025CD4B11|nr:type II toxin-antitoxin system VapC family toxin [uncultured Methanobrevibacter sp.]